MQSPVDELQAFDARYRSQNDFLLCGVDEAGRGPLCGPVGVGAVVLDPQNPIEGLRDSKKLSEKKRESLFAIIKEQCICWNVVLVPPEEIDRLNILGATMLGMRQAVEGLSQTPDFVLVDGNRMPEGISAGEGVVKGDSVSASIAAASIVAKVTRDHYMQVLDEEFPEYQLAKHKGYPTKLHYELLDQYGPQPFYRQSFLKKWKARHESG